MPLIDKAQKNIVYTNFEDEITEMRGDDVIDIPKMTGLQYEKKVKEYLSDHLDHIVIHRLRTNQALTETDLNGLDDTLTDIGDKDGKVLLSGPLKSSGSPSISVLVRQMVGMDRQAAVEAFSEFLSDRNLTSNQMRFVEMVIDQLTSRGVMGADVLYETPFTNIHSGGPEQLFSGQENVIQGLFEKLESLSSNLDKKAG
ncbi:MAG: hypothetical protein HOI01_00035 [Proteobacteria bacterium]|jgi:type I restriction enzyme, R subunit|nr:hypothetical protein [Pseudomonadota bacterium]MBT6531104.1 hypothetical protein [Betaproteobacteria bacterium]